MLAALEIPHLDGIVIAATGQPPAIGTHPERLDCSLMPLPKLQALPVLHVPPAHAPIAAATEQQRSGRTPGTTTDPVWLPRANPPGGAGGPPPHVPPLLIARSGKWGAIGTPRHTIEEGVVVVRVLQDLPSLSGSRVPQPDGIVQPATS